MQEVNFGLICNTLIERLRMKKEVDEEQVNVFLDGVMTDLSAAEEVGHESFPFQSLSDFINKMWFYRDFGRASRYQIFLYGSIWAGVKLIERKCAKKKSKGKLNELISYYIDKEWLLKAIYDHPGIRHKDLAKIGDMSVSQLSQVISRASKESLITYQRLGREKYYFLMERGETLYDEICKRKRLLQYNSNTEYGLAKCFVPCSTFRLDDEKFDFIENYDGMIEFGNYVTVSKERYSKIVELQRSVKALERNVISNKGLVMK